MTDQHYETTIGFPALGTTLFWAPKPAFKEPSNGEERNIAQTKRYCQMFPDTTLIEDHNNLMLRLRLRITENPWILRI